MWLDILRNIAEVLDIRFDTPVPLILEQQWMLVKESGLRLAMSRDRVTQHLPRIEPTHGMIALQTTIHDGRVALLCNTFFGRFHVHPVWISPHVGSNLPKLDSTRCVVRDRRLEGIIEVPIVEEDIGVVVPPIEVPLHRFQGLNNPVQVTVPRKDNECSVCPWV